MRSTEREDDEHYRSASFAHASHCRQLASNSAFAAEASVLIRNPQCPKSGANRI